MKRFGFVIMLTLAGALMYQGFALACASCGCSAEATDGNKVACAGCADGADCACGAKKSAGAMKSACAACDGGEMCAGCGVAARGMLSEMAAEVCGGCTADSLCELCDTMVAGSMDRMATIAPVEEAVEAFPLGYMAGKVSDDISAMFGQLMAAASEQGLVGEETHVGSVYPDLMVNGYNENTPFYAAFSLTTDAAPADPLAIFTVPAGNYLVFNHFGPYEELGSTWMAAFTWANMNGVELGHGAAMEHYVSDPETTDPAELLTQIYLPLHSGESHEGHDHG